MREVNVPIAAPWIAKTDAMPVRARDAGAGGRGGATWIRLAAMGLPSASS